MKYNKIKKQLLKLLPDLDELIESREYLSKGNIQLGIVNEILIQPHLLKISEATCPTISTTRLITSQIN